LEGLLGAMFLLGAASGLHCVAMCGGIVGAFSSSSRVIFRKEEMLKRQVAFNFGRISSYALAGAAAGALGTVAQYAGMVMSVQTGLYILAHAVVILVALQVAGFRNLLAPFERIGQPLWNRVQPLAIRFFSSIKTRNVFIAGLLWGALPCGLVYGALATAVLAGTPARGAAAMAAFGLGTLPWLLAAGTGAAQVRRHLDRAPVRAALALFLAGMGTWGLARASGIDGFLQEVISLCS
jgi:sulfite exporter TauE/SafE